jgi:hypothetical protein
MLFYIGNKDLYNKWKSENRKSLPSKNLANRFDIGYEDLRERLYTYFTSDRIDTN